MTADTRLAAAEEALTETVEVDDEDNDTQPTAPYAWMRNGGLVDDDYDDSDDAKEQEVEDFKSERAAKAKARAEGKAPVRLGDREGLVARGIKIVERDFTSDTDYIRHDPRKLARTIEDFASGWIK